MAAISKAGPNAPLEPRGARPTRRVPDSKRRIYTDLGEQTDLVLPADATLRGVIDLERVGLEGPATLDGCQGQLHDVWSTGRWALDPAMLRVPPYTAADRENMQAELNRKALKVVGGNVSIRRMRLENNDDVLAVGGGATLAIRHSSLRHVRGFVGTHRDLVDLDLAEWLTLEDCDLHHEAHCLLWCDSETGLNPNWRVGRVDLRRCKLTCDHVGPGSATRQVHLDARVGEAYVEDCLFDARPRQSLNVESAATLRVERGNVYWNDGPGGRKAGARIQVTNLNVHE